MPLSEVAIVITYVASSSLVSLVSLSPLSLLSPVAPSPSSQKTPT